MSGFTPRTRRNYVGTYRPRIDGPAKAAGRAEYLEDLALGIKFPGMLHAKVLRSPHAHCRLKRVDATRAEALPGVHAIITFEDPEAAAFKPTNCAWTGVDTVPYDRMYWAAFRDKRVFGPYCTWVGDEAGVAAAAETEAIAEEALRLLDLEWEIYEHVLDPREAVKPEAPRIHPEMNLGSNALPPEALCGGDVWFNRGDVDRALAESDVLVEVRSKYHNADHGCLDSMGCLIQWTEDKLVCWSNSYQGDQLRAHLCTMLDLPMHKVRVIIPYLGASMGRWNVGDQLFFLITALLSKRTGRPVRFKHTRREDFHDTRNSIEWHCRMGGNKDGVITGAHFTGLADAGGYVEHTIAALKFMTGFEVPECFLAPIGNLRFQGRSVYTNKIPGGCMRGIGNNQFNLCLLLAMDELAEKLGRDPLELAVKNFGHEWGQRPDVSVKALLEEGARRIGWENRRPAGQGPVYRGGRRRGLGFSVHMSWHAAWQEQPRGRVQLRVRLNPDGTVILDAPMVETGPGSNSCAVFACAEALSFLGVTPDDITWVDRVDTETTFKDMVQTDSAVSYLHAELMREAADQLREQVLERAAAVFKNPVDELDARGGLVFPRECPERGMSIRDILFQGDMTPLIASVNKVPPRETTGVPFAATFAEVEVDEATGLVDVLKIVQLNDCGTVMYASGVEAQQTGGQCLGLGEALFEEIVYDRKTGRPLNFNWIDYHIPTMADYPDIEPVPMEVWRGAGDYGPCGIGEVVTTNTPRAVANAVYNAIGVRVDDIPITPRKVLAALGKIGVRK
ncbi:MAG: xanthine dehydrogenase family protein molybdopterin-binding subunit [Pseudomonadota bacterium]